jgi:hypothetical protein
MRLSLYSVVAVLVIFAMAYRTRPRRLANPPTQNEVTFTLEAAYRDGLYLGRLHRRRGLASRPAWGRWNREADRRLFLDGYGRGYSGFTD